MRLLTVIAMSVVSLFNGEAGVVVMKKQASGQLGSFVQ